MLHYETIEGFPAKFIEEVETPCYLISEDVIRKNCQLLNMVQKKCGVKFLLALKAFSLPVLFPVISKYLYGVCSSGPVEARIGREDFGKEVHTYAPAFTKAQMEQTILYSDTIIFNSIRQLSIHGSAIAHSGRKINLGLRVNPGYSEVEVDLYNPCLPGSRLGLGPGDLTEADLGGISGFHFHSMCEQDADVLARTLSHFEEKFGRYLDLLEWVNFGGGHQITRADYDVGLLMDTLNSFQKRYPHLQVYLEPGEAVVFNGGLLVTEVLDIIYNGMNIGILDCSAETHMPDVLAMPYRPYVLSSSNPGEKSYTYRLGGISCLAGDVIGDYSFTRPLQVGDRLALTDMALYSFVKNTTFNGVELPSIYSCSEDGGVRLIKKFGYQDYRGRLA